MPLGTGNDLSRCLGWSEGYTNDVEIVDILRQIQTAKCVKLDRWQVQISRNGKADPQRLLMNNYLSVGCDALVTLNFHQKRQSLPFSNRLLNKV